MAITLTYPLTTGFFLIQLINQILYLAVIPLNVAVTFLVTSSLVVLELLHCIVCFGFHLSKGDQDLACIAMNMWKLIILFVFL